MRGFPPQLGRLLGARRFQDALPVSRNHVAVEDLLLDLHVRRSAVDLLEQLTVLAAAEDAEVMERLLLEVRMSIAARDVRDELASAGRPALRQHEKGALAIKFW